MASRLKTHALTTFMIGAAVTVCGKRVERDMASWWDTKTRAFVSAAKNSREWDATKPHHRCRKCVMRMEGLSIRTGRPLTKKSLKRLGRII